MKAYEVTTDDECKPQFAGTMADAKTLLKQMVEGAAGATYYANHQVVECEIQTDKEGILFILNGWPVIKRERTWRATARGGLKEVLPEDRGEAAAS